MKISTAYDAYWFLHDHPKMQCREVNLLPPGEPEVQIRGTRIRTIKDAATWNTGITYRMREWTSLERRALDCNLDIWYAKVDEAGKVNDACSKNVNIECWLEFGPIKQIVRDGILRVENSHDLRLDCGARTFDEALVRLARKVRRHYGDYRREV